MSVVRRALDWTEQGRLPDALVRAGIRRLCKSRLADIGVHNAEAAANRENAFIDAMRVAAIALVPEKANEQHYEVPSAFYTHVLGAHRKYSCCHFASPSTSLSDAEAAALAITCERAGIADGQQILELGCGWGSLTLWIAQRYPHARITGVSNSHSQREYVMAQARARGLGNIDVITCDMNAFDTGETFDRVVSVEMFEHMRNWPALFTSVERWLGPQGRFFMHVFVHRLVPYAFDVKDASDWMSEHFFSGGIMPSDTLALRSSAPLAIERQWRWNGRHYERTANAWLANLDASRDAVMPILAATYGEDAAPQWLQRWRIFFMACAELFGYDDGREWFVSHYRFMRPGESA